MNATLRLAVPDEALLDIRLTMTVGEAKRLQEQIKGDGARWPAWQLAAILTEAIQKAQQSFDGKHELNQ